MRYGPLVCAANPPGGKAPHSPAATGTIHREGNPAAMTAPDPGNPRPGRLARLAGRLAGWYRRQADNLDPPGAPRASSLSFTIEPGIGLVVRDDGRGCPIGWAGDADFARATTEAGPPGPGWVWLPRYHHGRYWPPPGYTPPPAAPPPLFSWIASDGARGQLAAIVLHATADGG